jgi:hypothetical protein
MGPLPGLQRKFVGANVRVLRRWTRSCPRTGGALCAIRSVPPNRTLSSAHRLHLYFAAASLKGLARADHASPA